MKPLFPRHRHIQHIQHTQSVLMIYPGERCQLSLCGSAEISQRNAKRAGYVRRVGEIESCLGMYHIVI